MKYWLSAGYYIRGSGYVKVTVFSRLWEEGWKQRYYKNKFDVDVTDEDFRKTVVKCYVEGLCWVLRYYYQVGLPTTFFSFFLNERRLLCISLIETY